LIALKKIIKNINVKLALNHNNDRIELEIAEIKKDLRE